MDIILCFYIVYKELTLHFPLFAFSSHPDTVQAQNGCKKVEQVTPEYPTGQSHKKCLLVLVQVPPLAQGLSLHLSMMVSHLLPV